MQGNDRSGRVRWLYAVFAVVAGGALIFTGAHGPPSTDESKGTVLARLLDEFTRNREAVDTNVEVLQRLGESVDVLLAGRAAELPDRNVAILFADLSSDRYGPIETRVVDSLLGSRGLNVVEDPELNGWLLQWPLLVNGLTDFERALREPVDIEREGSLRQRRQLGKRALEHCTRVRSAHGRILRALESRASS